MIYKTQLYKAIIKRLEVQWEIVLHVAKEQEKNDGQHHQPDKGTMTKSDSSWIVKGP